MFAESRSTRPTNLSLTSKANDSLVNFENHQLKLGAWEIILCRVFLLHLGLRAAKNPGRKQLSRIFGYSLLFLLTVLRSPVKAQSFEPLTPDRPNPPQPQPLPPSPNPLDGSLTAPPIPESVLDVPGTIMVDKFQFNGNSVFSQAELNQAIASFTDKPVSFAQLVQAANEITKLYVAKGYITSGAYLPEQNLNTGTVQIQVVEGNLAEIEVDVLSGRLKESYIRDRLQSRVAVPLNINQLQEELQLLQLNPLIKSLDAELSTGVQPGTNALAVSVIGADSFNLETRLNNSRNPSIGSFERGIKLEEGNLLGIGDRIYVAYDNTDGSSQYRGGYRLPINTRDGSVEFNFRVSNNEIVESPFDEIDIDVDSNEYDLTWRQPVFQRATPQLSQELALNLIASRRESKTSILDMSESFSPGADDNGEIRTSTLGFSQEWLQRNRQQVVSARSQFNLGLDAFDATVHSNEPDSQFFSWRGQFSYLRLLNEPQTRSSLGATILWRSELQLAAEPLVPTEQFSLGGVATVRGYRQDALLTDSGFSTSAEFRLPIARIPKVNATIQLSPFIDFGTGWNTDDEETEFNTLLGTGFGLLLQTEDRLSARIDWGIPLINSDSQGNTLQENGVYFQLEYNLF